MLPEADTVRFLELGKKIKEAYGRPLNYSSIEKNGNSYVISHNELSDSDWKIPRLERVSNTLVICEDITDGQNITSFSVYAYLPHYKNKKILVFEGKTVGHKLICKFAAVRASSFEVVINSSEGEHKIKDIKAYLVR